MAFSRKYQSLINHPLPPWTRGLWRGDNGISALTLSDAGGSPARALVDTFQVSFSPLILVLPSKSYRTTPATLTVPNPCSSRTDPSPPLTTSFPFLYHLPHPRPNPTTATSIVIKITRPTSHDCQGDRSDESAAGSSCSEQPLSRGPAPIRFLPLSPS